MPISVGRKGTPPANVLGTTETGVPTQTAQTQAGQQAAIAFTTASMLSSMIGAGLTASAGSAINNNPYGLPTRGFARGLWLSVTITSTGNTATVAAPTGVSNFPFCYLNNISLTKPNGDVLLPPNFNGYDAYLDNKYLARGIRPFDAKLSPVYSAPTTGAGATAGSGKFVLYVPFELDSVDAFGAQPNADGASQYQLNITTNTAAAAYGANYSATAGTAPNGTVNITIETMLDYWPVPAAQGAQIAPNSLGARSFLDMATPPVSSSSSNVKITTVGSNIRAVIFQLLNANGVRTDADWPNLTRLELEGVPFFSRYQDIWQDETARMYRYTGAKDSAGGIDSGVYVYFWPIARQGFVSPDSPRSQWLRTAPGSDFEFYPSVFGANAATLKIIASRVTMPSAANVNGSGR